MVRDCVDSIFKAQCAIEIEIDKYVILSSLQNYHFREYSLFVYRFGQKHAKPNISKIFKTNIILITKYLHLNWNIVKSFIFFILKKWLILNKHFQNCYLFQMDALGSI